jgi:hypothetical protein
MNLQQTLQPSAREESGLFVINVKYTMMTNALVSVLGYLLRDKRQTGALVSIDRPHTYVSKLLEKHAIPQDRLMFLDAVTNLSGEASLPNEKIELLSSPFCINFLTTFVSTHCAQAIASRSGFIMMDNLSALMPYMTEACVEKLIGIIESMQTRCIIVLDKDQHKGLFDIVIKHGAKEISITGDSIPL